MSARSGAKIRVTLTAGRDALWAGHAMATDQNDAPVTSSAENENPYEAAWNALAGVMTALGFDEDPSPAEADRSDSGGA